MRRISLTCVLVAAALLAAGPLVFAGGTQVSRQRKENERWRKAAENRQERYMKRAREY